jgi:hypothetical protein
MAVSAFVPSVTPSKLWDNTVNLTDAMLDVVQRS